MKCLRKVGHSKSPALSNSTKLSKPVPLTDSTELSKPVALTNSTKLSKPVTLTDSTKLSKPVTLTNSTKLSKPVALTDSTKLSKPVPLTDSTKLSRPVTLTDSTELSKLVALTNSTKLSKPVALTNSTKLSRLACEPHGFSFSSFPSGDEKNDLNISAPGQSELGSGFRNMRKMLPGIGVFGSTPAMRCYIPMFKSHGFEVVALWARMLEEAKQMSDELGVEVYTNDVDKVLLHKDVDLVVISCSPHLQTHIAAKALGIGKHVLCSPPSGPHSRDTLPMVHASRYYPRLMSLMCSGLRFLPSVVKMRALIKDGFIGEATICEAKVHYGHRLRNTFDWMCDEMMGGGVLNMYGGMVVDILSHVTGQRATRVQGILKTYTKQTEHVKGIREITSDDFCSFQMELDGGACATVTLNGHMPGQFVQEIIVVGSKGRVVLRGADLYGQKHDKVKEDLLHFDPVNYKDLESLGISEKVRGEIPVPYMKGVIRMVESVRDAFQQVEERQGWSPDPLDTAATFEDCFYVQTVVDAVRTASKLRQSVKVVMSDAEPESNPFLSTAMRRSTFSLH